MRLSRAIVAVSVLALQLAPCGPLPAGVGLASAEARPAPDKATQDRALALFDEGRTAYKQGRFADSVRALREAYALVEEPVLLYNLARAHEGLGEFREAIDAYARYLETATDIPDRGAIEAKLTSLRRELDERERLARERDEALRNQSSGPDGAKAGPGADAGASGGGPSPWPWVVTGLGGAVLAAGGVVGALALGTNGDAEEAPSQVEAAALREDAEGLATVSTVGFIAGGVLLAAGVTWGVLDLTGGSDTGAAALHLGPTGATFRLRF